MGTRSQTYGLYALRDAAPLKQRVDELSAKHDELADIQAQYKSGEKYDEQFLA